MAGRCFAQWQGLGEIFFDMGRGTSAKRVVTGHVNVLPVRVMLLPELPEINNSSLFIVVRVNCKQGTGNRIINLIGTMINNYL